MFFLLLSVCRQTQSLIKLRFITEIAVWRQSMLNGELLFQHRSLFSPPPPRVEWSAAGHSASLSRSMSLVHRRLRGTASSDGARSFLLGKAAWRAGLSGDDLKPESERSASTQKPCSESLEDLIWTSARVSPLPPSRGVTVHLRPGLCFLEPWAEEAESSEHPS